METGDLIDRLRSEWQRERPDLDTSGMGVVGRTILLGELLQKSAREAVEPFGLGYTDLDVLATLRRSGEPCALRPGTLLKTILLQSGSLTACLDRLEGRDLVVREPVPEDRRGSMVRLTSKGRRLIDRAIEARFEEARNAVAALDDDERRALEELLRKLLVARVASPLDLSSGIR